MKNEVKYIHETNVHNLIAPEEVVPILMNIFNPSSVLDVGCGIGTWLSVFKKHGVKEVVGIDGSYVNRDLLLNNIDFNEFISQDITLPFDLHKRFELGICLEVAEHLEVFAAETFVESLCRHSDIIVFAAAIPNQGGQNHMNEQWPEYWINNFKKNGYQCYDILRPKLWENDKVDWWYKQNIFVFSKKTLDFFVASNSFFSLIHPQHFEQKISYINLLNEKVNQLSIEVAKWESGEKGMRKYWSKFLKASIRKIIS